jgi:20S proteasome alpha/beta subunit
MTLILGARCSDGVVIMTDMKITSLVTGTPQFLRYESKISGVFTNIIFGYAGDVETYEIYLNYGVGDVVRKRDDPNDVYTNDNFIHKLHENMVKLRRVLARNNKPLFLRILVGRQFPRNKRSELHKVSSNFNPEIASIEASIDNYAVIGDAETCATELIKTRWKPDMRMGEFAELSYSVIRYIEEKGISAAVGLGLNKVPVRYLADIGNTDIALSNEEWEQFKKTYQTYADRFDKNTSPACQDHGR